MVNYKGNLSTNQLGWVYAVGEHASPGDFRMKPLIDLNPCDKSCILSTLKFILSKAEQLKIEIACVTFDQCIYPKAVEIVKAHNMELRKNLGKSPMLHELPRMH